MNATSGWRTRVLEPFVPLTAALFGKPYERGSDMTDLLESRKEVTPEEALEVPHDPTMHTRVARFGFEYEMLPHEYDGDDDYIDSDEVWSDDHSQCNCEDCIDQRIEEERERRHQEGTGDAYALISRAHAARLIRDNQMHSYHCSCSACEHTRTDFILTAQSDCSVGVEFVSRVLDLREGWDEARDGITEWIRVMNRWKDEGGWMPDGYESCGNHIHVSKGGDDSLGRFTESERHQAYQHINALYAAFDWTAVADGGCGGIRSYNQKPHKDNGAGSWLSDRGYGTIEHRLWNTPAIPERLWGHIGLSVALTRWAFALTQAKPGFTFWTPSTWSERMSDDTFYSLQHNINRVVDVLTDYIPDTPEFVVAHDLLGNLATL